MERLGARRGWIAAAIGPCIAQASYEVGEDFRAHFGPEDAQFFAPGRPGHAQFALEGYVVEQLRRAGIGAIDPLMALVSGGLCASSAASIGVSTSGG